MRVLRTHNATPIRIMSEIREWKKSGSLRRGAAKHGVIPMGGMRNADEPKYAPGQPDRGLWGRLYLSVKDEEIDFPVPFSGFSIPRLDIRWRTVYDRCSPDRRKYTQTHTRIFFR
jgi:hypothetical protein